MNQMQIPEKVIVTVRTAGGEFSADAELPTDMNVGRVRQGLLRLLRDRSPNLFSRVEEISLSLGDRPLDDAGTLAAQGVWA